jgi:hypothetical protein
VAVGAFADPSFPAPDTQSTIADDMPGYSCPPAPQPLIEIRRERRGPSLHPRCRVTRRSTRPCPGGAGHQALESL